MEAIGVSSIGSADDKTRYIKVGVGVLIAVGAAAGAAAYAGAFDEDAAPKYQPAYGVIVDEDVTF